MCVLFWVSVSICVMVGRVVLLLNSCSVFVLGY